ncbi:tail assembly chaperone [Arthrobacter phage Adaia]|uniref:Tail assembly chaperone n=1 Tax=Arthrobacter phage Adaia TaxID=2419945 RepID=A0A3G2KCT9_9CAUD|nr:tail assembly chaperone [Arthrobacter phage Adaia]AYN56799.1 tail assembly chaperone [Arthrobacter phage Adaia]WLV27494.1 tail assembly chaperone [Pseudomonas phage Hadban]
MAALAIESGIPPSVLEREPSEYLETMCYLAIHRYDETEGK